MQACTHIVLVKPVVSWQVLIVGTHSQMPLPHNSSAVPNLLQVLGNGGLIVGKSSNTWYMEHRWIDSRPYLVASSQQSSSEEASMYEGEKN